MCLAITVAFLVFLSLALELILVQSIPVFAPNAPY